CFALILLTAHPGGRHSSGMKPVVPPSGLSQSDFPSAGARPLPVRLPPRNRTSSCWVIEWRPFKSKSAAMLFVQSRYRFPIMTDISALFDRTGTIRRPDFTQLLEE